MAKSSQKKPTKKSTKAKKSQTRKARSKFSRFLRGFLLFCGSVSIVIALLIAAYAYQLNKQVVSKFEGKRWNLPAKVYAQPLNLYQGAFLSPQDLELSLQQLNYSKSASAQTSGTYTKKGNRFVINTRGFDYGFEKEVPQKVAVVFQNNYITRMSGTDAENGSFVRLEPLQIGGIYPDNNEDRILVSLDKVPQNLIDALLSTEDRTFYDHFGISIRGLSRAVYQTVVGGKRQGGSTITQQLIKNFYLTNERSIKRKAKEAVMAILLEANYSKEEILQAYLNEINLGQNGKKSVHGFALASQFYFNQPLSELSTEKMALLVGIAKGSSAYNPRRRPKSALNRRNIVIDNMVVTNTLSKAEAERLKKLPLGVVKKTSVSKKAYSDFLNIVKAQLKKDYNDEDLKNEGLNIFTTLDPIVQNKATASFDASIEKLRKGRRDNKNLQGALLTANPSNGDLLAIIGGYGTFTGYNRAVEAKRPVGSLLKPVVFLNGLASGQYNLASHVSDEPLAIKAGSKTWEPKNYDKVSHGEVPFYTALAKSYNQATVRVGMNVGIQEFKDTLTKMGITDKIPNYPSIFLGTLELTPMQVLELYQVFADGGFKNKINSIRTVVDARGNLLRANNIELTEGLRASDAFVTNYAMQQVVTSGTAQSLNSLGGLNLAGKTGTTNDYKDSWFAGYSGNYVTVVWVGNDDNTNTKLSGASGALPIWKNFMSKLSLEPVNIPQPNDVEWQWLELGTGLLSAESCEMAIFVPIHTSNMPSDVGNCEIPDEEGTFLERLLNTTDDNEDVSPEVQQALEEVQEWF